MRDPGGRGGAVRYERTHARPEKRVRGGIFFFKRRVTHVTRLGVQKHNFSEKGVSQTSLESRLRSLYN